MGHVSFSAVLTGAVADRVIAEWRRRPAEVLGKLRDYSGKR
jgi:hypothetical protein